MPDAKISDLTEDTAPAAGDFVATVDVSDATMGSTGTDRKVRLSNLGPALANLDGSSVATGTVAQARLPAPGTTSGTFADGLLVAQHTVSIGNNSSAISANTSAISAQATALAGKAGALVATAPKTSAYTAVPGDFVTVDATGGSVPITLPDAPADRTRIGVKVVAVTAPNVVTVLRDPAGTDVFNKAGGSTSLTLTLANQSYLLQYQASSGIWIVESGNLALSTLDARYAVLASPSFTGTVTIGTLGGLLKATSGAVSTAAAGTDYLAPGGSGAALTGITAGQVSGLAASATTDTTVATNIASGTLNAARLPGSAVQTISLATPGVLYTTPITFGVTAGAATGTLALATQTANTVLAGPTTGSAATPTMRALVAADLPATAVTAGAYTSANITVDAQGRITAAASGSGASIASTSLVLKGNGSGGAVAATAGTDYTPGTLTDSATSTTSAVATLTHKSSGTTALNFGAALDLALQDPQGTTATVGARIAAVGSSVFAGTVYGGTSLVLSTSNGGVLNPCAVVDYNGFWTVGFPSISTSTPQVGQFTCRVQASALVYGGIAYGILPSANADNNYAGISWGNASGSIAGNLSLQYVNAASAYGEMVVATRDAAGYNERMRVTAAGATVGNAVATAALKLAGQSSTTAGRGMGALAGAWATSTDASRKGRVQLYASDSTGTDREGVRVESDGAQALLSFYGGSAAAKPAVTGSRGGNAALASLLTALASLGLITDSTTA